MKSKVRVTDHAILRYLERAGGFEIEKLRAEIEKRIAASVPEGATAAQLDGVTFVIVKNCGDRYVTTVLERGWVHGHGVEGA